MKKISRSALLPYSAKKVYDLVNDVDRYAEFLPWCGGSEIKHATETEMQASVTIAKAGLQKTFTTLNKLQDGQRIDMSLIDGPFTDLVGVWEFKALDDDACKILFEVEFEVSNGVLNIAIGPIFEHIASTMVESFCQRAKQVYA